MQLIFRNFSLSCFLIHKRIFTLEEQDSSSDFPSARQVVKIAAVEGGRADFLCKGPGSRCFRARRDLCCMSYLVSLFFLKFKQPFKNGKSIPLEAEREQPLCPGAIVCRTLLNSVENGREF